MGKAVAAKKKKAVPAKQVRSSEVPTGFDSGGGKAPRFNILGYAEIDPENIQRHPKNPRPAFHLSDDDPGLKALGDSIKVDGQHRPAVVYELVGHYEDEDQPGVYRLYQGERRWRACKIAGVEKLRCFVVATPKNLAEEMDWLGVEEAFKQDWQPFFVLKYCHDLAQEHGVPVHSAEISAKTGVSMSDLKIAEKMFKLEPAIQYYAAEYEELMYEQLVKGKRKRGSRLSGAGVRSKEFPVTKAAAVYDIFAALREHCSILVKEYSDLELQQMIAQKATRGATLDDLQKLHGQIRQLGKNPPPGLLTEIDELLKNEDRAIKPFLRNTGVEESGKLNKFMQRSRNTRRIAAELVDVMEQVGSDPDDLEEVRTEALELIRDVSEVERQITNRVLQLRREQL